MNRLTADQLHTKVCIASLEKQTQRTIKLLNEAAEYSYSPQIIISQLQAISDMAGSLELSVFTVATNPDPWVLDADNGQAYCDTHKTYAKTCIDLLLKQISIAKQLANAVGLGELSADVSSCLEGLDLTAEYLKKGVSFLNDKPATSTEGAI